MERFTRLFGDLLVYVYHCFDRCYFADFNGVYGIG
jgi:hypothetical protein